MQPCKTSGSFEIFENYIKKTPDFQAMTYIWTHPCVGEDLVPLTERTNSFKTGRDVVLPGGCPESSLLKNANGDEHGDFLRDKHTQ